jgi:hypothetical protein
MSVSSSAAGGELGQDANDGTSPFPGNFLLAGRVGMNTIIGILFGVKPRILVDDDNW